MSLNKDFLEPDSCAKDEKSTCSIKKYIPWILNALLLIIVIVLSVIIAKSKKHDSTTTTTTNPVKDEQLIPFYDPLLQYGKFAGGAVYQKKNDILTSRYYPMIDFYNEKTSGTLKIIEKFRTYQQTNDCSCGCGCLVMVADHYGINLTEKYCAKIANVGTSEKKNTHGYKGTFPSDLIKTIKGLGLIPESPENFTEDENPVNDQTTFMNYVIDAIEKKEPIIVLHQDWAGHYLVIIGYDSMGTENTGDDVLITADPFDTTDHRQDGYNIWSFERFYALLGTKIGIYENTTEIIRNFYARVKKSN